MPAPYDPESPLRADATDEQIIARYHAPSGSAPRGTPPTRADLFHIVMGILLPLFPESISSEQGWWAHDKAYKIADAVLAAFSLRGGLADRVDSAVANGAARPLERAR